MGAYTVSVGVADSDTGESSSGASVSAALGGGTLTVGYSQQTLGGERYSCFSWFASVNTATATFYINCCNKR